MKSELVKALLPVIFKREAERISDEIVQAMNKHMPLEDKELLNRQKEKMDKLEAELYKVLGDKKNLLNDYSDALIGVLCIESSFTYETALKISLNKIEPLVSLLEKIEQEEIKFDKVKNPV